jgi:ABC-type Fe3+-siderophore transport system permease subunit
VNHHDITADAVKAVPTLAVAATGVLGVDWSTVTYMLTAIYTMLLIAQFCRRAYKAWQLDRKTARDNAARDKRRRVVEKVVAKREAQ